jgi:soluble lytic murein transglycosylase
MPELEEAWARAVEGYQGGDVSALLERFGDETALVSPIADYARFLTAEALARGDDLTAARTAALAVVDRHPDSPLAPAALILAATLADRAGDEAQVLAILERLIVTYRDAAELPEALYLLGMSGEARGQPEAAAHAYQKLRVLAPASGWASGAEDRLAVLVVAGVRLPELSPTERIERAEALLRGGVPKTASDEAERIVKEAREPGLLVRALKVVAEASQRLARQETAVRILEAALSRLPAERRPAIQLELGRLLLRTNQRQRALTVLSTVEHHGAEAEAAEAAYLRGRGLEELDETAKAATTYRSLAARYPTREVAGAALWRAGWLAYTRHDVPGAEQTWLKLTELPGGRAYRMGALYWVGRAVEQRRGREGSEAFYRRVVNESPRSYYGILAARRLSAGSAEQVGQPLPATGSGPAPAVRLPDDPQEALATDPGFARVALLRRIGLAEFATLELSSVALRSVGDPVRLYGLSGAYVREERYHLALRILRRHFATLAAGASALPRAFWEMLYPFGWRSELTEAAERAGLDPFLVAAVVREESSYYPRAISRAGARGLMQLMPGTAQPMAQVRGLTFSHDLLDEPRANLELGTAFLAGLIQEFADPRLAVAAYNAGPNRLRQWYQARRTNDLEAFVELIPFEETRGYVKRVMLAWEEYRRLYGSAESGPALPERR